MYDLTHFTLKDMTLCGSALRELGADVTNREEVLDRVMRYLYEHLRVGSSDERACVLVRYFEICAFESLDTEQRQAAQVMLSDHTLAPETQCLTLWATAGDEPAWNDRHSSVAHQAIPLPNVQALEQAPMIAPLLTQLGLSTQQVLTADRSQILDVEHTLFDVFLVSDALGSPYVPAQEDFVIPFGVQSVLGIGGGLPNGNIFVVLLFSKVPIDRQTAELFKPLAMNIKVLILPFTQ